MGGDGGSVIQRVDMVRTKGYGTAQPSSRGGMGYQPNSVRRIETETVDPKRLRRLSMRHCALTQQLLAGAPIVACRAGYLYNKESVLDRLLSKTLPLNFSHITSLKDLLNVASISVCPISRRDLDDGVTRAVVLWPCGCMFSHKVVGSGDTCPICQTSVTQKVVLFPDNEEERSNQLKLAMELRTNKSTKKRVASDNNDSDMKKVDIKSDKSLLHTKIFHDANHIQKKDAFGRAFSSKGVGI